ncbi:MAG: hypothetical protein NC211_06980 [Alistipes senegalensis]|nr:hypothetical protein [Oxalobacter formigenes]MCM1281554.1 hypothetical protein [Alistipes senegalensis]
MLEGAFALKNLSSGRDGRSRPWAFSDLFLWHPLLEMELMKLSRSGLADFIASDNPENAKMLKRVFYDIGRKEGKEDIKKRMRKVLHIFKELSRILDVSWKFIMGMARRRMPWNAFFYGISHGDISKLSPLALHIIEVEKELKVPTLKFCKKEMQACCDILKTSCPNVRKHLDEDVFGILQGIQDPKEFWPYRAMVMLDIQLSVIAYTGSIILPDIDLHDFFPEFDADPLVHPNVKFFLWLEKEAGGKQSLISLIPQINKKEKDRDIESVKHLYRKWKEGTMPSNESLTVLLEKLYAADKKKVEIANKIYYVIRRINFFFITLFKKVREKNGGILVHSGYHSIQEWFEGRYNYWLQHWSSISKSIS